MTKKPATAAVTVTISTDEINELVSDRVLEQVSETVRDRVSRTIQERASAVADAAIKERLAPEIEAAIRDGWPQTDGYGRDTGKRKTVRDLVLEHLTAHDRYSGNGQWMERATKETFNAIFREQIEPELKKAKEMFKEMLDSAIKTRLADALKSALGLG